MRFYPPNPGPRPFRPSPGPRPFDSFFGPFPSSRRPPYQNSGPTYQAPRHFSRGLTQRPPQGAPVPPKRPGILGSLLQGLTQGPSQEAAPPPQGPGIPANTNQVSSYEEAGSPPQTDFLGNNDQLPPQGGAGNPPQTPGMWGNVNQMLTYADELSRGINTLRQIGSVFTKK